MKNASTREFLECIDHQEATLKYHDRYFFVNGCSVSLDPLTKRKLFVELEVSEVDGENYTRAINWIATIQKPSIEECVDEFCRIKLVDGKTFWELENELEWL